MGSDKTNRLINRMKQSGKETFQTVTPIASGIVIPNHSGSTKDPVRDGDIATKAYADSVGSGAPEGTAVKSTGEAGGSKFLREDGDGTSSWQTVPGSGAPEGTEVLSTGEAGGVKFLREDGDGTSSWQAVSETNDLTAAVTWDDVPIANIPFGTAGQQLTTNEGATAMELQLASKYIEARKGSAGTITAGSAVYISGYNVGGWLEVELTDANAAATMPAVGLAFESITNAASSRVIMSGNTNGLVNTSSWSVGDAVYVSETAGALTNVKPQGTALIQKIGTVGRDNAINGQLTVIGAGRTNDLPNLANTKMWIGDSNGVPQEFAMSGGATMTAGGVVTIADKFLKNDAADVGVGLSLTGDNASADTTYVPNVLYNTDATPPTASTVPIGTIYIQYTA